MADRNYYVFIRLVLRHSLWGLLISFFIFSKVFCCEDFPQVSKEEWESYPQWEGYYANCSNGFAITIPKGFIGRSTPPPAPHHGFGIWLSQTPSAYIWVDGSLNSLEWESPEQAANQHLEWIKKDAQSIVSISQEKLFLEKLSAIRLIVKYTCSDSGEITKVEDYFLALDYRGLVYTIALSSDLTTYDEYRAILEHLAKTFHLIEFCK